LALWRDRGFVLDVPDWQRAAADRPQPYLAGNDAWRRQELVRGWNDPSVRALICGRGGYGALRLLEGLDWRTLLPEPKWLVGFSDVTALLWGMAARLGRGGGIHGPVATTLTEATAGPLFAWLMGSTTSLTLAGHPLVAGVAEGKLLAGNLCVATHLLGTTWMPITPKEPWILAIEDVGEEPYRVDRLLTHWRLSGVLSQVAGIAVGQFIGASDGAPAGDRGADVPSPWRALWQDRLGDLGIPVVTDLGFGHGEQNPPLGIGCRAVLDGDRGLLQVWR
jgi:muramoyltetrapeptide carboxypeptidase